MLLWMEKKNGELRIYEVRGVVWRSMGLFEWILYDLTVHWLSIKTMEPGLLEAESDEDCPF